MIFSAEACRRQFWGWPSTTNPWIPSARNSQRTFPKTDVVTVEVPVVETDRDSLVVADEEADVEGVDVADTLGVDETVSDAVDEPDVDAVVDPDSVFVEEAVVESDPESDVDAEVDAEVEAEVDMLVVAEELPLDDREVDSL